jgi:NMD protein affecting ribosome stability and mRNA decay
MFHLKRWRQPEGLQPDLLSIAEWDECPACRQEGRGPAGGVVALRGDWEAARREEILRRIENVAARAEHTQPQHRVLEIREVDGGIEVSTTSQKVAHRIAHELEKAFGGHARYSWSDRDGRLLATWNA